MCCVGPTSEYLYQLSYDEGLGTRELAVLVAVHVVGSSGILPAFEAMQDSEREAAAGVGAVLACSATLRAKVFEKHVAFFAAK